MGPAIKPIKWTKKFFEVKTIAPEPPLNKEGFWKKYGTSKKTKKRN